jgi:hypothetical protein
MQSSKPCCSSISLVRITLAALLFISVCVSLTFLLTTRSVNGIGIFRSGESSLRGFEIFPTVGMQERYLQAALGGGILYPPNPWRAALSRGRLDWHDLVSIDTPPKNMAPLQRHLRDDAKDALLSMLQNTGPREHTAASRPAMGWAQERLIAQLRRANSSASITDLLTSSSAMADAAIVANVDLDDISEHRRGAEDGSPLGGCTIVRDKCLHHSTLNACVREAFCGWCVARSTCLTRNAAYVTCEEQPGALSSLTSQSSSIRVRGKQLAKASGVLVVDTQTLVVPTVSRHKLRGIDGSVSPNCSYIIRDNVMKVEIKGDSRMAYHWVTETLPKWMLSARKGGLRNINNVVIINGEWNDLLSWASIFTHTCSRHTESSEVKAACFVHVEKKDHAVVKELQLSLIDAYTGQLIEHLDTQNTALLLEPLDVALRGGMPLNAEESLKALETISKGGVDAAAWLPLLGDFIKLEGLYEVAANVANRIRAIHPDDFGSVAARECGVWWWDNTLVNVRPVVVIISRLNKRLILNEPDLVRAALALGAEVHVAALEQMSVCAQVRLFQRANVVVGVHGSALINSILMRPKSVLLQIVPFAVRGAATFFESPAKSRGVRYLELVIDQRVATIPHEHFLKPSVTAEKLYNDVKEGITIAQDTWFSFMINQDSIVNVKKFMDVLKNALKLSQGQ